MEWIAKYENNIYLLSDEAPNLNDDLVVYVSPEDKTVVVDHFNEPGESIITKVTWYYEPSYIKLAKKTTYLYMPYVTSVSPQTIASELVPVQPMMSRYSEIELNDDFYLPIEIRNNE
jgi:hypothetical protein